MWGRVAGGGGAAVGRRYDQRRGRREYPVEDGVGMTHLEDTKKKNGLNLDIHIFVYVYKVHMCIYMFRGGMRSWTNCFFSLTYFFFRKRKAKDVNAKHRRSQILIPRFERTDPHHHNKATCKTVQPLPRKSLLVHYILLMCCRMI